MIQLALSLEQSKRPKLSRQQQIIVDLFDQFGEVSNVMICMGRPAFNHTGRISELRQKGYKIEVIRKGENGLRFYRMTREGER